MDDSMQRVTYGELKQKIIDVGRHLSVRATGRDRDGK